FDRLPLERKVACLAAVKSREHRVFHSRRECIELAGSAGPLFRNEAYFEFSVIIACGKSISPRIDEQPGTLIIDAVIKAPVAKKQVTTRELTSRTRQGTARWQT